MTGGLVSVIVPMHNAVRFVRETLASVLAQTYPHWELIVVDDGSTDGSLEIARELTSDARVRVFSQANSGVSSARNRGLSMSTGEFAAFLDADDLWLPNNLALKVEFLRRHPEVGLAQSDVAVADGTSQVTGEMLLGGEGRVLETLLEWRGDPIPLLPSNAVFPRRVLDEIGGFDPAFSTAADQDLKFRLAARYPVGRVPEACVIYRVHGSNMHLDIALMERDHLAVYRKAARLGLFPSPAFRRRCLANMYLILAGSWWRSGRRMRGAAFALLAVLTNLRLVARMPAKVARALRRGNPQAKRGSTLSD